MTKALSTRGTITSRIVLLTAAGMLGTWALACMTPFAALATLMAVVWAVSQGVGFGILHDPHDPKTIEWGAALGLPAAPTVARVPAFA